MHRALGRTGRTIAAAVLGGVLTVLGAAGPAGVSSSAMAATDPKVVIIVGPVGSLTDTYRAAAEEGARAARRLTSNVVTIYSPDATWPTVRNALQGASIVVYLGHGNGWPSRYSSQPRPLTQNGLGLNPLAGGGDAAHQYFGESYIARDVHLAPHALVLFHHLCYASGNSEPGLPEGSLATGEQRVDNYAAGWLAAGADAVIADAYFGPAWYLKTALKGKGTVESMWRAAPSYNGHAFSFSSVRTPGATAVMDPDTTDHGFHRSLVERGASSLPHLRGGGGRVVRQGAPRVTTGTSHPESLASAGATIGIPVLTTESGGLAADTSATLRLPIAVPGSGAGLAGSVLGVRWVPVLVTDPTQASGISSGPPGGDPQGTGSIDATTPESPGDVVATTVTTHEAGALSASVMLPPVPGIYRLVTTIHDAAGTAFDAATQALVAPVLVRVSGHVSVSFGVAPQLTLDSGEHATIPVLVANDGVEPWTQDAPWTLVRPRAMVTATWTALGAGVDTSADLTAGEVSLDPGQSTVIDLPVIAPAVAGSYLVVLDLVSPVYGSLLALGIPPVTVRVAVRPSPAAVPPNP